MASELDFLNNLLYSGSAVKTPQTPELPSTPNINEMFRMTPMDEDRARAEEKLRKLLSATSGQEIQLDAPQNMSVGEPASTESSPARQIASAPAVPQEIPNIQPMKEVSPENIDLEDKEMNEAISNANQIRQAALLGEAASQIGTAIGTSGRETYSQLHPEGYKRIFELADQQTKDVKEKRAALDSQIKRQNDLAELDTVREKARPDSAISELYRQNVVMAAPQLAASVKGMSAAQLEKIFPAIQQAANIREAIAARKEIAKANAEAKNDKDKAKKDEQDYTHLERYHKEVAKLQEKQKESQQYIDSAIALAEEATRNPQASLNLARGVVKAIEGAGARVSDKDFTSAVGDASIAGTMMDTYTKLSKGVRRAVTKKQVIEMLEGVKKIQDQKQAQAFDDVTKRYSIRAGIPQEEAYKLGGLNTPPPKFEENRVQVKTPEGKIVLVPKDKLKAAIDAGGEVVP